MPWGGTIGAGRNLLRINTSNIRERTYMVTFDWPDQDRQQRSDEVGEELFAHRYTTDNQNK
jgi:hypothetical protein